MDTTAHHPILRLPPPNVSPLHLLHPHFYADDGIELEKFISFYAFSLAYLLLQAGRAAEFISIFARFNKKKLECLTRWKKIGSNI